MKHSPILMRIFMCIVSLLLFLLWYKLYRKFLIELADISNMKSASFIKELSKKEKSFRPKLNASIKSKDLKYILMWTSPKNVPFVYLEEGQRRFIKNRCKFKNCYVTPDRFYLEDYTQFDAVIFAGPDLVTEDIDLPSRRSVNQKYVFASIESSHTYAICSKRYDGFFNWTWTYRLDSECRWGYIVVKNKKNRIIGPNRKVPWMKFDDMKPVSEEFRKGLLTKTTAAAWFVSNCRTASGREDFVQNLIVELKFYGHFVDTYGRCGSLKCPREDQKICDEMIKQKYYFYLAFENSFSIDYVTEKLLHGLQNNAIPVVYGGANYTRFMPDGMYLDARTLGPKRLADKMNELIGNPHKYAEYFRWTNHYIYAKRSESVLTDDYCGMCKLLNNKKIMKRKSVYMNFKEWWDPPNVC
ncbi:alpha-(1,3)-fucosyltransferase C-like [Amyelois transitella]|uniref:alpha-(1,3)-fucosyltransferase C-like n=1 Tax=Amyelois transitella TaxID=680683 RepID=UPI00299058D8|nr:alpha-(1,3)-fucosyltransferase C-like [Amyelois transitella]